MGDGRVGGWVGGGEGRRGGGEGGRGGGRDAPLEVPRLGPQQPLCVHVVCPEGLAAVLEFVGAARWVREREGGEGTNFTRGFGETSGTNGKIGQK